MSGNERGATGRGPLVAGALLFVAVMLLYAPVLRYPYITIDDRTLAEQNPFVRGGAAWGNVARNLFATHEGYWAPVTWLSFFLERRVVGIAPGVFHASNVALHAANAALLLALLWRLTGRVWPPALAAAIFAVHPAHVESVAWIAERKDVLSLLFGLGALHVWLGWVRKPRAGFPAAALALFSLSLTAKPMLVVLPALLLLLDFWPLGRFRAETLRALLVEKLPFAAVAAALAAVTVAAQAGSIADTVAVTPATRAAYALVAPLYYLRTLIWPAGLAFAYPVRVQPYPLWIVLLSPCLVAGALWWAIRGRVRRPWALAGLLWFLATLAPVSGVVQAGLTIVMDRVVYVPGLGLWLALTGGLGAWTAGGARRATAATAVGAVVVAALTVLSVRQIGYWKDDCALFGRTVAVAPDSAVGQWNLAVCLFERGDAAGALEHTLEARRLRPGDPVAAFRLGTMCDSLGKYPEAVEAFREALELGDRGAGVRAALGVALGSLGRLEESVEQLREARRLDPASATVAYNLGVALLRLGRAAEAVEPLEAAVRANPGDQRALHNLAAARRQARLAPEGGARR